MTIEEIEAKARVSGCTTEEKARILAHYNPTGATHKCSECGKFSTGSVGAAGIFRKSLCQACKDEYDGALLQSVKATSFVMRSIFGK